ncbi:MAG: hypothetical protein JWN86_473 [Planctomycetota bacterium]|nr:hypothetical protein [Planctomycetota bacterium]
MNQTRIALFSLVVSIGIGSRADADVSPFARFDLPDPWEARFWADPGVEGLLKLDTKALAALVPVQAGLKHARCPKCAANEADDPLSWSNVKPESLHCRKCGATLPDDHIPAKTDGKVPEEVVEVRPRVFHRYPYHRVEAETQRYPDERIYLGAKRDYEVREFLAKAALYAAVRYRERASDQTNSNLARIACVILVRFAQVYPLYATHFDPIGGPKYFDRADLSPPYRRGYGTAKWDSSGCLDVPLNLVIAYALMRDDPAMLEAGKALGDGHPNRTIEHDLFRASAEFVRGQPEEFAETSLYAYRGMLAVGRLIDDPGLVHEAQARLDGFLARGFYHDGLWRLGDATAHRRVVGQIDGWIDRLLTGYSDPPRYIPPDGSRRFEKHVGASQLPMVELARSASDASWFDPRSSTPDFQLASWPAPAPKTGARRPALLGGAGIARLGIGQGDDALDLELRGLGDLGGMPSGRLALRVAVAGRPVLGDLDGNASTAWGFERATASRNGLVMVDGLNQRETIDALNDPAPGSDILFFAAEPDFQVVQLGDRFAYPRSTKRYRHTVLASAGPKTRYAVSVFEVEGGLQHDQVFHGGSAVGGAPWRLSVATDRGPESLLPPGMPFVATTRPEGGRWFVQSMGAFEDLFQARLDRPAQAVLGTPGTTGVRLHLLNEVKTSAIVGRSAGGSADGRPALIVRRRSEEGRNLSTTFVTVIEPLGVSPPLRRVGRIATSAGVVAIAIEASEGVEYLVLNGSPGEACETDLPDGRVVKTDGLAVRITKAGPTLAGGTFVQVGDSRLIQARITGTVVASGRVERGPARGQFRVSESLSKPEQVAGRTLLIRHGDGSSRGWTLVSAENLAEGGARLFVREEAGFRIDPESKVARYDRLPGTLVPGPHRFAIPRIAR